MSICRKISVKHNKKANHRTQNPVFDFSGNKGVLDELDSTEPTKTLTLHSLTGVNFRTFLSMYRIDHAKRLLTSAAGKSLSITQIATECAFLLDFKNQLCYNQSISYAASTT
jgi:hypothetical protein